MNKYLTVAKVNFKKTTWISYLVAAICAFAMIVDTFLDIVLLKVSGDSTVSAYSMMYIVCLLAPILIASVNYSKMINIGVKKKIYFVGCFINYIVFAAIISLIGVLEHYLIDPVIGKHETVYGLISVFGWDTSVIGAFFSQFAFLMLFQVIVHTLTFIQTKWYGWMTDILIVVIISVFTPIPALRAVEVFIFNMTIFAQPAIIHIVICLVLSVDFYSTNLFYLKNCNN